MPYIPILLIFIALAIFVTVALRIKGKDYGRKFEDFFEAENEANFIKSKEIGAEIFFKPDLSKLPIKPIMADSTDDKLSLRNQAEVLKKAENIMVKLPAPMSNNEIKHKYGTVNLEIISIYEENFFAYTYALNSWAESLFDEGNVKDAETVLYQGVKSGAETSKTFTMLADIYYKNNDRQKMSELYEIVSNRKMPAQDKAWRYVNDYYIKMKL